MPLATLIPNRSRTVRLVCAGLACAAVVALTAELGSAEVVSKAQVKAAFLYNFTRFVEWPAQAFSAPHAPIVIGVLGEPALMQDLETIVAGRKVNGRAIVVRAIESASDAETAQVLFVSAAEDAGFAELHGSLANRAMLTVGESPTFAAAGGAVVFVEHAGKLRFEINVAAAESAQVKISAELQKLAMAVRSAP